MRSQDIMHPEDAKAIQMIKKVPLCESLVRLFMEMGYEAQYRGENLANMIQISPNYLSDVYTLFKKVVKIVGIKEPELYVYNDPVLNAYTFGETHTFIAISSGMLETMSSEELKGVIAHECGHILCKHSLYETIYQTIQEMGFILGALHRSLFAPLYLALQYWNRKSELSADRCGAAVVGEECYQKALIKLASGLKETPPDSNRLVEQGRQYEAFKHSSLWNRIQQDYRCIFYSHPQLCTRAVELSRWKISYNYKMLRTICH